MHLFHLCECVCHSTVSGRWHFSASITIAPSVLLSLQPWRRVMSPVSLKTPTYNACPPHIPTPPYSAQAVHHPLTPTLTSPPLDLAVSPVPQLLSSCPPPQITLDPSVRWLLYIQMANHHTPVWLFRSCYRFSLPWPKTANMPLGRQHTDWVEKSGAGSWVFVWISVQLGPVFNYSPRRGRVEVYALYGNVIDYNCPLNINQVY